MSGSKIPVAAGLVAVLFIGVNENIAWITTPALVVAAVAVAAFVLKKSGVSVPAFHGHGNTKSGALTHEKRHKKLCDAFNIRTGGWFTAAISVWKENGSWAGVCRVNNSASNMARWNALSPAEQAAVYIAGSPSLGRKDDFGCSDDMANVDARAPRHVARRIAQRHL